MTKDNRMPADKIIGAWKAENGIKRVSEKGTPYVIIKANMTNLEILADTLIEQGYSVDEISTPSFAVKIANICWREDKIQKMSNSEVNKAKYSLALDWSELLCHNKYTKLVMAKGGDIRFDNVEKEEPIAVPTEPEMAELASRTDKLRNPNISTEEDEEDTEFLKLMGIPSERSK